MTNKSSRTPSQDAHHLDQLSFFPETVVQQAPPPPAPAAPSYQKGRLYRVAVADLLPDPSQPRKHFDEEALDELAVSIARHGLLQPVIFRQEPDGSIFTVAGGRRLAAARQAGLKTIPAICSDGQAAEIALVENLIRQDLGCIEEAEAVERLKSSHDYTLADLSAILGKSVSTLSEIISLTRLPLEIRDECRTRRDMARSILVEIAKCPSDEEMIALYQRYCQKGLSRHALRSRNTEKQAPQQHYHRLCRSFSRKITTIDVKALAGKERQKVRSELEGLKEIIDRHLSELVN